MKNRTESIRVVLWLIVMLRKKPPSNMNTQIIQELEEQSHAASKKLRLATEQMWPEGTAVRVMLSAVQKNPSPGVVVGCHAGELCVRLDKPNRRGYGTVKHVHWRKVCA
jgi:hypothetical protein